MSDSPANLVAIIVAARKVGDRHLEREAKRLLEREHGVKLSFCRPRSDVKREAVS